jgi:catechol 2,3-dioxygenase-like lactoylglutathione lyase family enzyme
MSRSEQSLFTFVPVSDGDRAKLFYGDVLGLTLLEDSPFAVVFKVPGGTLRLARTPDFQPQPFSLVGWLVDDLATDMADLADKGVSFEKFEGLPQDEAGVWTVPDGTRVCWFRDPDGNLLSLTQSAG